MTWEVIENGWLRPASTLKTAVKETIRQEHAKAVEEGTLGAYNKLINALKKERGGRIPLGEKGVGRFASHRLGRWLSLKTKVLDLDYEYVLEVDWDKFQAVDGEVKDLESVGLSLSRQAPSRDYGKVNSGTQLVIYGGREGFSWDRETIEGLHRSIAGLNSPYPSPKNPDAASGFRAFLECPQLGTFSTENPANSFPPTFSFDGLVDDDGVLEYSLKFQPPKGVPMPEETMEEKSFDLRKAEYPPLVHRHGRSPKTRVRGVLSAPRRLVSQKSLDKHGGARRQGIHRLSHEFRRHLDFQGRHKHLPGGMGRGNRLAQPEQASHQAGVQDVVLQHDRQPGDQSNVQHRLGRQDQSRRIDREPRIS